MEPQQSSSTDGQFHEPRSNYSAPENIVNNGNATSNSACLNYNPVYSGNEQLNNQTDLLEYFRRCEENLVHVRWLAEFNKQQVHHKLDSINFDLNNIKNQLVSSRINSDLTTESRVNLQRLYDGVVHSNQNLQATIRDLQNQLQRKTAENELDKNRIKTLDEFATKIRLENGMNVRKIGQLYQVLIKIGLTQDHVTYLDSELTKISKNPAIKSVNFDDFVTDLQKNNLITKTSNELKTDKQTQTTIE